MDIIYLMIGGSAVIALLFLYFFFWNVKSGQYEDTYSPSVRILFDDDLKKQEQKNLKETEIKNKD